MSHYLLSVVQDSAYPALRAAPDTIWVLRSEPGFFLGLSRAEVFQLATAVTAAAAAIFATFLAAITLLREHRHEAEEVRATAALLAAEVEANADWMEDDLERHSKRGKQITLTNVLVRDLALRIVWDKIRLLPNGVPLRILRLYHHFDIVRDWAARQREAFDEVRAAPELDTLEGEEGYHVVTRVCYENMAETLKAARAILPELHRLSEPA